MLFTSHNFQVIKNAYMYVYMYVAWWSFKQGYGEFVGFGET